MAKGKGAMRASARAKGNRPMLVDSGNEEDEQAPLVPKKEKKFRYKDTIAKKSVMCERMIDAESL
ncbi:unnamed protein product, partial [Ilex paraguariensis]